MFRRDTSAHFESFGFWIFKRFHFGAGKLEVSYGRSDYDEIHRLQVESPVKVMSDELRRRAYWMFRGEFYWEDEVFTEMEVKAFALERNSQRDRRAQRAVALMEQKNLPPSPRRAPIGQALRLAVFQRDAVR